MKSTQLMLRCAVIVSIVAPPLLLIAFIQTGFDNLSVLIPLSILVIYIIVQLLSLHQYKKIHAEIALRLNVNTRYYLHQRVKRRGKNHFDAILLPSLKHKEMREWGSSRKLVNDARRLKAQIQQILDELDAIQTPPETESEIKDFLVYSRFAEAHSYLALAKAESQTDRIQTYN